MDVIVYFHFALVGALFVFYYSKKDDSSEIFSQCKTDLNNFKQRMTGEVTSMITSLAIPTPDVIITNTETQTLNYFEGNSNPLKGEKFKNWIDSYISTEFNSLKFYYEYQLIYKRWAGCVRRMNLFVLIFAIFELVSAGICFYWNSFCNRTEEGKIVFKGYFLCVQDCSTWLMVSGVISGTLLVAGVLSLVYMDHLKNKMLKCRDVNYGI